jgi:hypothetical protein
MCPCQPDWFVGSLGNNISFVPLYDIQQLQVILDLAAAPVLQMIIQPSRKPSCGLTFPAGEYL